MAVVSAADPVDRRTGRLIHLPDAPFLLGELDPAAVLAPEVGGPVTVDNDVNWAARAERDHAGAALDDFAYLFLGEGLGCAIVSDGEVRRGHGGLAGEIAHLITAGPRGRAVPFIEVFGQLGLRHARTTAIDVDELLAAVTGPVPRRRPPAVSSARPSPESLPPSSRSPTPNTSLSADRGAATPSSSTSSRRPPRACPAPPPSAPPG